MSFSTPKNLLIERLKGSVGCLRERKDSWDVKTPVSASCLEWDDEVDMRTPLSEFVWTSTTPLVGSPATRLFSWQWDEQLFDVLELAAEEEKIEVRGSLVSRETFKDDVKSEDIEDQSETDEVFTSPKIPFKDLDLNIAFNFGLNEWDNLMERMERLHLSARKLNKEFLDNSDG